MDIYPVGDRVLVRDHKAPTTGIEIPDNMKIDGLSWFEIVNCNSHPFLRDGDYVLAASNAARKGQYGDDKFTILSVKDIWAYKQNQV